MVASSVVRRAEEEGVLQSCSFSGEETYFEELFEQILRNLGLFRSIWDKFGQIRTISNKFGQIRMNSEKFGWIRTNLDKFGWTRTNSEKLGLIRTKSINIEQAQIRIWIYPIFFAQLTPNLSECISIGPLAEVSDFLAAAISRKANEKLIIAKHLNDFKTNEWQFAKSTSSLVIAFVKPLIVSGP